MYQYISLADIMPNLLLILVVSTAYMHGRMSGLLVGIFSGLLVDFMYGSYVIGIYAMLYMLIGYFVGYLNRFYSNDDYTLPLVIIAVSDFIFGFFYYVIEFLLRGRLNILFYLRRMILPEIIYTVAVAVFLYKLFHMIDNHLERKLEKEV